MAYEKMKVVSTDGKEFEIGQDIAKQSKLLRSYFNDGLDEPIKLPLLDSSIMESVIEFCEHHKNDPEPEFSDDDDDDDLSTKKDVQQLKQGKPLSEWDQAFIRRFSVHDGSLFDIVTAGNYLDIPILLHTICKSVIYLIRGKSSEEIREIFKLTEMAKDGSTKESTSGHSSLSSQIDIRQA